MLSGGYVREDVGVIKAGIPGGLAGQHLPLFPLRAAQKIKTLSKGGGKKPPPAAGFIDPTGSGNENTRRKHRTCAAIRSKKLN